MKLPCNIDASEFIKALKNTATNPADKQAAIFGLQRNKTASIKLLYLIMPLYESEL